MDKNLIITIIAGLLFSMGGFGQDVIGEGHVPHVIQLQTGEPVLFFHLEDDIYLARYDAKQNKFKNPEIIINSKDGIATGNERGVSAAHVGVFTAVSFVDKKGNVQVYYSEDLEKWKEGSDQVNAEKGSAAAGFVGLAGNPSKRRLYCIWYDNRRIEGGNDIYISWSFDAKKWSDNILLYESPDSTINECSRPVIKREYNDSIYVLFRNQIDGNRNMYLIRSDWQVNNISEAEKLGKDLNWKSTDCIVDGGGLTIHHRVPVAVYQVAGELYLKSQGASPVKLDIGSHPDIIFWKTNYQISYTKGGAVYAGTTGKVIPKRLGRGDYSEIIEYKKMPMIFWEDKGKIMFWTLLK